MSVYLSVCLSARACFAMQPAMPTSCCHRDCSLCCSTLCDELFRSVPDLELDGDMCSLNKFMTVIVLCDYSNHAVESLHL